MFLYSLRSCVCKSSLSGRFATRSALNQIIDMFMKMNVVDDASIKRCPIITSNEIKAFEFDDVDFYLFLLPPFSQKNK